MKFDMEQNYAKWIEIERLKKEVFEKELISKFRDKDKKQLERKLFNLHPLIIEANLIA